MIRITKRVMRVVIADDPNSFPVQISDYFFAQGFGDGFSF